MDIVFVIDGSGSIPPAAFELQKAGIRSCFAGPNAFIPIDGSVAVVLPSEPEMLGAPDGGGELMGGELLAEEILLLEESGSGESLGAGVTALARIALHGSGADTATLPAGGTERVRNRIGIGGRASRPPLVGTASSRSIRRSDCVCIPALHSATLGGVAHLFEDGEVIEPVSERPMPPAFVR